MDTSSAIDAAEQVGESVDWTPVLDSLSSLQEQLQTLLTWQTMIFCLGLVLVGVIIGSAVALVLQRFLK